MEMTIGEAADLLYQTRQERYKQQKEVDRLAEEETKLRDWIINNLPKGTSGAQGQVARVSVETEEEPQIEDFVVFVKYCNRTKQYDMLQRRLSSKAIKDRWLAGKRVPGVGKFGVVKVHLNKV